MNKKELLKKVKEYELNYDYESCYTDLYNMCINYMNDSQDWSLEYVFEDYVDEEIITELVKHKIENEGLWSVNNLLSDINNYNGIYYIDVYGYGHDIDMDDLETIKQEIIDRLENE